MLSFNNPPMINPLFCGFPGASFALLVPFVVNKQKNPCVPQAGFLCQDKKEHHQTKSGVMLTILRILPMLRISAPVSALKPRTIARFYLPKCG